MWVLERHTLGPAGGGGGGGGGGGEERALMRVRASLLEHALEAVQVQQPQQPQQPKQPKQPQLRRDWLPPARTLPRSFNLAVSLCPSRPRPSRVPAHHRLRFPLSRTLVLSPPPLAPPLAKPKGPNREGGRGEGRENAEIEKENERDRVTKEKKEGERIGEGRRGREGGRQ